MMVHVYGAFVIIITFFFIHICDMSFLVVSLLVCVLFFFFCMSLFSFFVSSCLAFFLSAYAFAVYAFVFFRVSDASRCAMLHTLCYVSFSFCFLLLLFFWGWG